MSTTSSDLSFTMIVKLKATSRVASIKSRKVRKGWDFCKRSAKESEVLQARSDAVVGVAVDATLTPVAGRTFLRNSSDARACLGCLRIVPLTCNPSNLHGSGWLLLIKVPSLAADKRSRFLKKQQMEKF